MKKERKKANKVRGSVPCSSAFFPPVRNKAAGQENNMAASILFIKVRQYHSDILVHGLGPELKVIDAAHYLQLNCSDKITGATRLRQGTKVIDATLSRTRHSGAENLPASNRIFARH